MVWPRPPSCFVLFSQIWLEKQASCLPPPSGLAVVSSLGWPCLSLAVPLPTSSDTGVHRGLCEVLGRRVPNFCRSRSIPTSQNNGPCLSVCMLVPENGASSEQQGVFVCVSVCVSLIFLCPAGGQRGLEWWRLSPASVSANARGGLERAALSPDGAFVSWVHGRVLGAVEDPAELLELRDAAQDPTGERERREE